MQLTARPSGPLSGLARVPGDKSISHRALIMGALALGVTEIEGLLEGADVMATAAAMRAFGAQIDRLGPGRWRIVGRGGFSQPEGVIDCGNAGTGVRLIMGAAAGYPLTATFTGDASLRSRPMNRVLDPLRQMGLRAEASEGGRLPATIHGGGLKGLAYRSPVASAQVKSAILLAGLRAEGPVSVTETPTRDHTETMLRWFGVAVESRAEPGGAATVSLPASRALRPDPADPVLRVSPDISSAAFPLVAALIAPGSDVTVEGLMANPTRAGLVQALKLMGANLAPGPSYNVGGEIVSDLRVRAGGLKGAVIPPEIAPSMIDEYPILAVAAAFAEGTTVMRGIGEMRVKESDRIALMARGLAACGVAVEEEPEGLIVHGRGGRVAGGASVKTAGDHRIAMSHLVLGLGAQNPVTVDEPEMIGTSFPGFVDLMRGLGADLGADIA